jgi:catechol 2,3-dioxygenase-like lactoylglutathione lyase family enzyme
VDRALELGPLDQVSLFCRDVERSTRFYGRVLGLPHLGTYGDLVFFDMNGVRLYLHRKDEAEWRPGSVLYFLTEDLEGQTSALERAGVRVSGRPHLIHREEATGEETWMAFFEDPDGNLLALTSRIASREVP